MPNFYGKKLHTAIREYLEMRGKQNLGPAKPREIYDAIVAGGFKFEARDENVALVGMRALLRKRTAFFHKLPNGSYGLTSWYPDAKKPKSAAAASQGSTEEEEDDLGIADPRRRRPLHQKAQQPPRELHRSGVCAPGKVHSDCPEEKGEGAMWFMARTLPAGRPRVA